MKTEVVEKKAEKLAMKKIISYIILLVLVLLAQLWWYFKSLNIVMIIVN